MEVPKKGDKLFIGKSGIGLDYASINRIKGLNNEHSFFLFIEGYRETSKELLDKLIQDKQLDWLKIDSKIYPILFLFRHYLEIIQKDIIRHTNLVKSKSATDEIGFEPEHSLKKLWEQLRPIIEENYQNYDAELKKKCRLGDDAVEELITELDSLDSGSYGFRYPFEKAQKKDPKIHYALPELTTELKNLRDSMNKLIHYFEGIHSQAIASLDEVQRI